MALLPATSNGLHSRNIPALTKLTAFLLLVVAATLFGWAPAVAADEDVDAPDIVGQGVVQKLDAMPLLFVENRGQVVGDVDFYLHGAEASLYFAPGGITIVLNGDAPSDWAAGLLPADERQVEQYAMRLRFVGAVATVRPVGEEAQPGTINYLRADPADQHTGVRTFGRIVYYNLWPGIDLVYRGDRDALKYEFVVHPGADPGQIRLRYEGASSLTVGVQGQLVVEIPLRTFEDAVPYAHQSVDGAEIPVEMAYLLEPTGEGAAPGTVHGFGFALGAYNPALPLVMDPIILINGGMLGGAEHIVTLNEVAVDAAGRVYVAGLTGNEVGNKVLPTIVGPVLNKRCPAPGVTYCVEGFVARISLDGASFDYLGYLGLFPGNISLAVDDSGHAYVAGTTGPGSKMPVVGPLGPEYNGGDSDVFIGKVKPDGSGFVYSAYLGGASRDEGNDIAVDQDGNAYLVGTTSSSEATFPIRNGPDSTYNNYYDGFIIKVDPAGETIVYSGYVGGGDEDRAYGVALDKTGHVVIVGWTNSTPDTFPVLGGPETEKDSDWDGFIGKLRPDGSGFEFLGYLGGDSLDGISEVKIDSVDNIYVSGVTWSTQESFPIVQLPRQEFAWGEATYFVAKISTQGEIIYSGYLPHDGNNGGSTPYLAVDRWGSAYVGSADGSGTTMKIRADGTRYIVRMILPFRPSAISAAQDGTLYAVGGKGLNLYGEVYCGLPDWVYWSPPCSESADPGMFGRFGYWPNLAVGPDQIDFSAVQGQGNPPAKSFTVQDDEGADYFDWSVSTNAPWIHLSTAQPDGSPATVWVNVDTKDLAPGYHSAYVRVRVDTFDHYSTIVQVSLTLGDGGDPVLSVAPGQLWLTAINGALQEQSSSIVVTNLGPETLTWNAAVSVGSSWLEIVGPTTGVAANTPVTVPVRIKSLASMAPGSYSGTVTVSSADALGSPQQVQVNLTVYPPPVLATSPKTQLNFNVLYENGDTARQMINIFNAGGGGPIDWTAQATTIDGAGWLTLDRLSGGTPSMLVASVNAAGLTLGQSYRGRIEIASPGAQDGPRTINVLLTYGTQMNFRPSVTSLTFDMVRSEPTPPSQILMIARSGGSLRSFPWQVEMTPPVDWLTLDKSQGTGASATNITVGVSPGALPNGVYETELRFSGSIAQGLPRSIPVFLSIGDVATAPDCQKADQLLANSAKARLQLVNIVARPNGDGTCSITAQIRIDLPQMGTLTYSVSGTIDASNRLNALVNANNDFDLDIGTMKLRLSNVRLENQKLTADATWRLTGVFTVQPSAGKIWIDRNGLNFAGSQSFVFNPPVSGSVGVFTVRLSKATLGVDTNTDSYTLKLDGSMNIVVANGPSASANMAVVIDRGGIDRTSISAFTLKGLAGLDLGVSGAQIARETLTAATASFKAPKEWGGLNATVTGLSISKSGKISIGGGSFSLPNINAGGGFGLSALKGSFAVQGGEYTISADGAFKLPLGEGSGSCTLEAGVTFRWDKAASASVIELGEPHRTLAADGSVVRAASRNEADGVKFDRFKLGVWNCPVTYGIPIGSTSFYLTGVRGTVILASGIKSLTIEIQVRSWASIGGKALVGAEARATIETKPPALDFRGVVYLAGLKASETGVYISKKNGMTATVVFNYAGVFHANFEINTWVKDRRFYLTGSGNAQAILEKGRLGSGCISYYFDKICASLPPNDWKSPMVNAEFGHFTSGHFGIKGSIHFDYSIKGIQIISFRGGFYVDSSGHMSIGNVDRFVLATRDTLLAAQQLRAAQASGNVEAADAASADLATLAESGDTLLLSGPVDFGPGIVSIDVTLPEPVVAADATEPLTVTIRSDLLFVVAQPLTGTLAFELVSPSGVVATPASLPGGIAYQEDVAGETRQGTFAVAMAQPGAWRMRILGDTVNTPYVVMALGNIPAPVMTNTTLTPQGGDNYKVDWRLQSTAKSATINIYANSGDLQRTVEMTQTDGSVTSQVVENFVGQPVDVALPTRLDGGPNTATISLADLPTGQYHLWIEADDGRNPPTRKQLGTVTVAHASTFPAGAITSVQSAEVAGAPPAAWQTTFNLQEEMGSGTLYAEWSANGHSDIDLYRVRLRTNDPLAGNVEVIEEYSVGDVTSTMLGGIEPGRTYYLAVGAEDIETDRIAWSQEEVIVTSQPDFALRVNYQALAAEGIMLEANASSLDASTLVIVAGQQVIVPIEFLLPENLPDVVALVADLEQLPFGIDVEFSTQVLAASGSVGVMLSVSPQLRPGYYTVPIVAVSGLLERRIGLVVQVAAPGSRVHLPVVIKQ